MSLKLKYWQLPVLFIPFIAGSIIEDWPQSDNEAYLRTSATANFLFVLNTCVLIYYQTYFALGFNRVSTKKSNIFKWNALVPVFFFTAYLLMVVYSTFIKAVVHQNKHFRGPIQKADFNPTTWVIFVFIIHALITFF